MIKVTEEYISKARDLIAYGNPEAAGYRLIIKPIDATRSLEESEKNQFQTLSQLNFETKTSDQAERESRGSQHGILMHAGPGAFKGDLSVDDWPKEGDVVIFDRYTGVEMELPPGSGEKFRFTNDESILGKMVKNDE